jgi:hypothetical protein
MLLLVGHDLSFSTEDGSVFCKEETNAHMFCLLPHTTPIFRLLGASCFTQLKFPSY